MVIDIVYLILVLMAIIKGFKRGLVVALFSVVAFIVGIAAAIKLSALVAVYLRHNINVANQWLPILSFAAVFFIVVVLVRLGANLVEKTVQMAMLGWANRVGGIILYAGLYTIILGVVLFYTNKMGFIKQETIHSSSTYGFVSNCGPWAIDGFGKVVPICKGMFGDLEAFFDGVAQKTA